MISKTRFVETLKFIKERDDLQANLCDALEKMSSECYVDAYIYDDYKQTVLTLLKEGLNIDDNGDLEYWMCDLEYGTKYYDGCLKDEKTGDNIDISTAEKLYDYLTGGNK